MMRGGKGMNIYIVAGYDLKEQWKRTEALTTAMIDETAADYGIEPEDLMEVLAMLWMRSKHKFGHGFAEQRQPHLAA
jgi:hypothetical protein